jgi:hypothetical protein
MYCGWLMSEETTVGGVAERCSNDPSCSAFTYFREQRTMDVWSGSDMPDVQETTWWVVGGWGVEWSEECTDDEAGSQ